MSASVACLSSRTTMLVIAAPPPRSAAAPSAAATRVLVGSGGSVGGVSTSGAGGEITPRNNRCRCTCGGAGDLLQGTRSWLVDNSAGERAPTLKRWTTRMALVESDMGSEEEVGRSRPFLRARNEEELLSCVWKEVESRRFSSDVAARLEELYYNYRNAVMQSGSPNSREIILSNMAVLFVRILLDSEDPFRFPPYHKAIREPFDYYMFGQNYLRPLINFRTSYVGNISLFFEIEENIQQGHNVVLFSNHQTEPDPALIALLLERTNSRISEAMIFVAGDRVITDPLCKPFSMGRNLLSVYSKKHMNDIPELIEMKRRANTRSLKEMALLLRGGSQLIWIAPSGGRDRPNPLTGEWHPAPFDSSSVDNMRRLVEHSGVPWHIYPLSLLCYEVMPPPPDVEKQIGERREIAFHGIGLSLAPEMNFHEITAGCANPKEAKDVFTQALYDSVTEQYNVLKTAIYNHQGLDASNSIVSLSQPWL